MVGIFTGLKVIDAATYVAAPSAATILGDFGASVVKLEPPGGDAYRALGSAPGLPRGDTNYPWVLDNRGKRGLTLDLKRPEAQAVLHHLIRTTDVFVTNSVPRLRTSLGIAPEMLMAINPRLVYAALTAYGETGPEADKTGFDATAYWARSGLMDLVRPHAGAPPARSVSGMGDHPAGLALYGAIATALYRRERTGQGGFVYASLLDAGLWANSFMVQAALDGAEFIPRPPRDQAPNAMSNLYRAGCGQWFLLALLNEPRQWPALLAVLGSPDWGDDPRFATPALRRENAQILIGLLDEAFAGRTLAEWRPLLDGAGLTFDAIATTQDAAQAAQPRATGAIRQTTAGGWTVDSPLHIAGQSKSPAAPPPPVPGADTDAILAEHGYTTAEIRSLRDAGAFGR
ncbi:CoA transferase [Siccirubricoccus sp. KC 17139]|uniref:CoA transferase n=1 Tax=Siccirubricoccus soli TaxID=2899147 RepID=A0ABT1D3L8_9PROT|nr:CoA transferase [Siccirubricoccus soli]MCO6416516.1 CoA transferase [Siccirubricoccus soli]MCP2682650.1 CoA transferase [Siccirubricoccus soli]